MGDLMDAAEKSIEYALETEEKSRAGEFQPVSL
jgi:hypothetical protein